VRANAVSGGIGSFVVMAHGASALKDSPAKAGKPSKNPREGTLRLTGLPSIFGAMQHVMESPNKIKYKEDREATPRYGGDSH
jgi:hypothetical protein